MLTKSLFVFAFLAIALASLSCMDQNNKPTPWFSLIKYPGNVTNSSARYAYLDPSLGSSYQIVLGSHCDDKGQPLPNTIAGINYTPLEDLNLLVYNDEPPNVPYNPDGGHAKGILAYDNKTQTGVYIMHSFPKYPNVSDKDGYVTYYLPSNTIEYAQNAYCITIDQNIFEQLLGNLPVEWPNVYYASGVFNTTVWNSTVMHQVTTFSLSNGDNIWFMTKSPNFTGFLYEDVIIPYFQVPLAVESWGRPYQDPRCPPNITYPCVNIDQIYFNAQDTWDHYSDHAKWAISVGGTKNIACHCDMNRMDTQEVRGGSCLCNENPYIYGALSKIAQSTDKCSSDFLHF